MEALLEGKKWPKGLPEIKEKSVAYQIAGEMLKQQFFHRSEKIETKKGFLRVHIFLFLYSVSYNSVPLLKGVKKASLRGGGLLHVDVFW